MKNKPRIYKEPIPLSGPVYEEIRAILSKTATNRGGIFVDSVQIRPYAVKVNVLGNQFVLLMFNVTYQTVREGVDTIENARFFAGKSLKSTLNKLVEILRKSSPEEVLSPDILTPCHGVDYAITKTIPNKHQWAVIRNTSGGYHVEVVFDNREDAVSYLNLIGSPRHDVIWLPCVKSKIKEV